MLIVFSDLALAANHLDDPQQNDGADQCHQHGRNGDGVIDRPDTQEGADEVTGNERADDAYYDIEYQFPAANSCA